METTQTSKISERKAALRLTSNTVQELMDAGKIKATNLNDGLLAFYNGKKKNQVWMTLEQWQTAGYSVRKGETAQMIWGKKVDKTNEAGEAFSYFPILFVFSNAQVDRTVRNFNSAAVKSETLPQADVASALGPVTGEDLPF
ncbi:MAG: ArdC-like ssDNA-binding domain-containing protein [Bacteroidales bacterium]|nr:ArdC-like ssDNA-binding domain-containing protein [Bacteroidales bacterium]